MDRPSPVKKDLRNCLYSLRPTDKNINIDEVDFPPNDYIYRKRDAFFLMGGIATYISDWVLDLLTAYNHWTHGNFNWFYFTLIFTIGPSLVITMVSSWWYVLDGMNNTRPKSGSCFRRYLARTIFHIFQLAPILRYLECLFYGLLSRKEWKNGNKALQRHLYTLMLFEDADCVLLRLIEGFMESIPQLMLQLYILFQYQTFLNNPIWDKLLWLSCLSSLLSVAWGVTAYFRDSRFTDVHKDNISMKGTMILLLWQFFSIGSRVLAIVIFSSLVNLWVVLASCFAHWLLMFIWLMGRRSFKQIGSIAYEFLLSTVFAAIYVFAFINDKDEPTRKKYAAFYTLFAMENLGMMTVWLVFGDVTVWYYYPGVIVHYVAFTLALLIMILYYGRFHPKHSLEKMSPNQDCSLPILCSLGDKFRSSSPTILERNPNSLCIAALRSKDRVSSSFSSSCLNSSARKDCNRDAFRHSNPALPLQDSANSSGNTSSVVSQCTVYDNAESCCITSPIVDDIHNLELGEKCLNMELHVVKTESSKFS